MNENKQVKVVVPISSEEFSELMDGGGSNMIIT